jgi:hypothetical protein
MLPQPGEYGRPRVLLPVEQLARGTDLGVADQRTATKGHPTQGGQVSRQDLVAANSAARSPSSSRHGLSGGKELSDLLWRHRLA